MVKPYILVLAPGCGSVYAETYKIESYSFIKNLNSKATIYRIVCPENQVTLMRLRGLPVLEITSEDMLFEVHGEKFYLIPNKYGK